MRGAPMNQQYATERGAPKGKTVSLKIEAGLSMLNSCPRISLLLNKSELASAHFGSYGYGYNYPSGEGDGLRSDETAPA